MVCRKSYCQSYAAFRASYYFNELVFGIVYHECGFAPGAYDLFALHMCEGLKDLCMILDFCLRAKGLGIFFYAAGCVVGCVWLRGVVVGCVY